MKATIDGPSGPVIETRPEGRFLDGKPLPTWFGILQKYARTVKPNDMESIRQSIAVGIVKERNL